MFHVKRACDKSLYLPMIVAKHVSMDIRARIVSRETAAILGRGYFDPAVFATTLACGGDLRIISKEHVDDAPF